jgi:hypothetical protein
MLSLGTDDSRLVDKTFRSILPSMSTLAEIEAAIERLPVPQLEELAHWIEQRRAMSAARRPAKTSVRNFFGAACTGRATGSENLRIDRDLAIEAAGSQTDAIG